VKKYRGKGRKVERERERKRRKQKERKKEIGSVDTNWIHLAQISDH
jgi:hypothetical protein